MDTVPLLARFLFRHAAGKERPKERPMQDASTYRQYAEDCRRLANTMSEKDRKIMLTMAAAWDSRAGEAERIQRKKFDGQEDRATKPRNKIAGGSTTEI
jgi:hypothetical protein